MSRVQNVIGKLFLIIVVLSMTWQIGLTQKAEVEKQEQVFRVVEEMPTARVCQNLTDDVLSYLCLNTELYGYIYSHDSIVGLEVQNSFIQTITVIIEADGTLSNVVHNRSENVEVKNIMNAILNDMSNEKFFYPGRQSGEFVRVKYTLPIALKKGKEYGALSKVSDYVFELEDDFITSFEKPIKLKGKDFSWERLNEYKERCNLKPNIQDWLWKKNGRVKLECD